jgi:hypothetical protein
MDHGFRRWRRHLRCEAKVRRLDRVEDGGDAFRALGMAFGSVPDLLRVGE